MTLRAEREANGIRLEDMAEGLGIPINELCQLELASTRYHDLLARHRAEHAPTSK